jgi:hypothetical protein
MEARVDRLYDGALRLGSTEGRGYQAHSLLGGARC